MEVPWVLPMGLHLGFGIWVWIFVWLRKEVDKIKKPPEAEEKRIGLFGGTFNPIHLGHLRGVEEIREAFGLRKVIFIPAAIHPTRQTRGHRGKAPTQDG